MRPQKPDSEVEMINQLWYAVIGSNGEGIAKRVSSIDNRLLKVESKLPDFLTYDEHEKMKKEAKDNKWRKQDVIFTALLLFISVVNLVIALR